MVSAVAGGQQPAEKQEGAASAYIETVMAEIDQEVRARRNSGDLPARVERELDELFLEFSPVSGGTEASEPLRMVDASAFINPVVPVESAKSGGAAIKRAMRSLSLWYINFVVQQVNQFSSAVSRCLHVLENRVGSLEHELAALRTAETAVFEVPSVHRADAWWVQVVSEAMASAPGRVLHAACGDGWLVRVLGERGVDAYGVDPRSDPTEMAESAGLDLRSEPVMEHLRAVAPAGLGGVVLTGLVESMTVGELRRLLDACAECLAPDGVLGVHSLAPSWWSSEEAPAEADLVPGRPLRAGTWAALLRDRGFDIALARGAEVAQGPSSSRSRRSQAPSADLLVVGRRSEGLSPAR